MPSFLLPETPTKSTTIPHAGQIPADRVLPSLHENNSWSSSRSSRIKQREAESLSGSHTTDDDGNNLLNDSNFQTYRADNSIASRNKAIKLHLSHDCPETSNSNAISSSSSSIASTYSSPPQIDLEKSTIMAGVPPFQLRGALIRTENSVRSLEQELEEETKVQKSLEEENRYVCMYVCISIRPSVLSCFGFSL